MLGSLPQFFTGNAFRTLTLCLWGIQLGLSLSIVTYSARLNRMFRRHGRGGYRSLLFWHVIIACLVFDLMSTEISWKTIFRGIDNDATWWTYANPFIYVANCVTLYLILRVSRRRYVVTKIRYRELASGKHSRKENLDR